jgi:tRNA dimethylallyltransferase
MKNIVHEKSNADAGLPSLLIIAGPTASGKSELAVDLAEKYDGEVVNADSMQVYSELRIGTARPSGELIARVPHHLLGVVSPATNFTAADFCREARRTVAEIIARNKLPVICGGTGLYIKVLLGGINDSPAADPLLRAALTELADIEGNAALHARLKAVDPLTAARLNINDRVRIIRAIEVFQHSGRSFSEYHAGHGFTEKWCRALQIGIDVDRATLYERIDLRVERMFADGLVDEVRGLLAAGCSSELKALRSIGYKEVCAYLEGRTTLAETVRLVKRDTRRYAKRQLTWFRGDASVNWYRYPESYSEICAAAEAFLGQLP